MDGNYRDRLALMFDAARRIRMDVSALEDGFEERVLARLGRAAPKAESLADAIGLLPAWNPAPVFAALCLMALAWAMFSPHAGTDLSSYALGIFDMDSLGQILPANLTSLGLVS